MHHYLRLFLFTILIVIGCHAYALQINSNLLNNRNDPYAGNANGKIVVVEFFDYQCSYCRNMSDVMENIVKTNPNLKVVFKEFPIRGEMSEYAARAALAANKQGLYKPFHHDLMNTNEKLDKKTILAIAKRNGINITKLEADMQNKAIINHVEDNLKLGQELDINGTPAFVIAPANATNSDQLNTFLGAMSPSELQHHIQTIKSH